MARDYARERRYRSRGKSSASSWRWLAAGLILGLVIAGAFYLKENASQLHKTVQTHLPKEHKKSAAHKKQNQHTKTKATETTGTQFDFYTVLPKMSVETPNTTPSSRTSSVPSEPKKLPPDDIKKEPAHQNTERYLLRLAAVKSYDKADQLKAELIMRGYDVSIDKAISNKETFYRVNVGPFSSRDTAIQQQKALQKEQIPSTVLKLPNN